jgi:hypothetical protein
LTVSRFDAIIPHVPPMPRRSGSRPATHYAGIALPNLFPCLSYSLLSCLPSFFPTLLCSLTEQKKSKPRASNPFVFRKIQSPISTTPFDSCACKFRGRVFFSASISPSVFADPSFRAHAHFRYNLPALAPSGLPRPVGAAQELVSR